MRRQLPARIKLSKKEVSQPGSEGTQGRQALRGRRYPTAVQPRPPRKTATRHPASTCPHRDRLSRLIPPHPALAAFPLTQGRKREGCSGTGGGRRGGRVSNPLPQGNQRLRQALPGEAPAGVGEGGGWDSRAGRARPGPRRRSPRVPLCPRRAAPLPGSAATRFIHEPVLAGCLRLSPPSRLRPALPPPRPLPPNGRLTPAPDARAAPPIGRARRLSLTYGERGAGSGGACAGGGARVSLLVQPRPLRASPQSRPLPQLYGPSPLRRRTPAGSSAASSASASSWFCSSCPRRWRPHPGCMIRLQSSMSNHIPVSADRLTDSDPSPPRLPPPDPRPTPGRLPACARLPRLSYPAFLSSPPRPPRVSSMLSLCSVAQATPAPGGFSQRWAAAPLGRAAGEPSQPGCGAARPSCRPRRPSLPAGPPPALPGEEEGATSPRLPSRPAPGTKPLCAPGCCRPRPPARPPPADVCLAASAGRGGRREGQRPCS